jgi:hypothetical protein
MWLSTAGMPKPIAPSSPTSSASHWGAGGGWLIFALPPAEVAVHPADTDGWSDLYLMCDDLAAEKQTLEGKGVSCSQVEEARWGSVTLIRLPGGGGVGPYQPKHPSAFTRG